MSTRVCTKWDQRLHAAALRGDVRELVRVLDSGRVHVDCTDRDGTTPLVLAAANGHLDCVRELLEQGADPCIRRYTGTGALFFAAQGGYTDIVDMMLDNGVPIDQASKDGGTALIVASQCGHLDVVTGLLGRGANPHVTMRDRATAVFVGAQNGHAGVVRALLRAGGRVDVRRADGASALWIASQMGHSSVVRELLGSGANPDMPRKDGATALFKASHKGHVEVVRALLPYRPRLGLLKNGESALHAAALYGHTEVVRLLLRAGADPMLKNDQGMTPVHIATRSGHSTTARLLKETPPSPKRSPRLTGSQGSLSRGSSQPGSLETIVEVSPPPPRAAGAGICASSELTAMMDGSICQRTNASSTNSLPRSAPSPSPSIVSEPPQSVSLHRPQARVFSHSDLQAVRSLFSRTFSSFKSAGLARRSMSQKAST